MPARSTRDALARTRDQADASPKPFNTKIADDDPGRVTADFGPEVKRLMRIAAAEDGVSVSEWLRQLATTALRSRNQGIKES